MSLLAGALAAGSLLGGCFLPGPGPQPLGLTISPGSLTFQVEAGGGAGTQSVTISTDVDASAFDLAITGTGFAIVSTTCPTLGGTLAAGSSCTATLSFGSATETTQTGQFFAIGDNPAGDDITVSIGLTGTAIN